MNNLLLGLLSNSAILSSAVTNDGKTHLANMIGNNASSWQYMSMITGNGTTAAVATDTGAIGNLTGALDTNSSYSADYKSVWKKTWNYSNIENHIYSEALIAKNSSVITNNCLARIVFDPITLNISDSVAITMTLGF